MLVFFRLGSAKSSKETESDTHLLKSEKQTHHGLRAVTAGLTLTAARNRRRRHRLADAQCDHSG